MISTDSVLNEVTMETLIQLTEYRLIPVLGEARSKYTDLLVDALHASHLPVLEITQRHPEALELVRLMSAEANLIIGAGTVLNVTQAEACLKAGARFLVSPGYSSEVVQFGRDHHIPVIPGVATATEIMGALGSGVSTMKFFPAGLLGGPAGLRAISSVFPNATFIPTGGVSLKNLGDYLAIPNVVAVGGTWVLPSELLDSGDVHGISELLTTARLQAARLVT